MLTGYFDIQSIYLIVFKQEIGNIDFKNNIN